MSFIDKAKEFMGVKEIQNIIKEFGHYGEAEKKLVVESKDRIQSLKAYGKTEVPLLKQALDSLGESFEDIDSAREEQIDNMKEKFIVPLNNLIEDINSLYTELKEKDHVFRDLENVKNKLAKLRKKSKEKIKADQLETAEKAVEEAENVFKSEEAKANQMTEDLNRKKLETMKSVLVDIIKDEKEFHEKVLGLMSNVKEKVDLLNL
jgi:hypothetical protein